MPFRSSNPFPHAKVYNEQPSKQEILIVRDLFKTWKRSVLFKTGFVSDARPFTLHSILSMSRLSVLAFKCCCTHFRWDLKLKSIKLAPEATLRSRFATADGCLSTSTLLTGKNLTKCLKKQRPKSLTDVMVNHPIILKKPSTWPLCSIGHNAVSVLGLRLNPTDTFETPYIGTTSD